MLAAAALTGCNTPNTPKVSRVETQESCGKNCSTDRLAQGDLDDVYSTLLYSRLAVKDILDVAFMGGARCQRCKWPADVVRMHTDWYEGMKWVGNTFEYGGRGIFFLCEDCWSEPLTEEHCVAYARRALSEYKWETSKWPLVEDAVRRDRKEWEKNRCNLPGQHIALSPQ